MKIILLYKHVIIFLSTSYPQIEDNLWKQSIIHIFMKNNYKNKITRYWKKEFLPYIYGGFLMKNARKARKHQCL